jgi:hypothetical protein
MAEETGFTKTCVELQGLLRLHLQPADVAELMRRMMPPLTHRGRTTKGFDRRVRDSARSSSTKHH